MQVVIVVTKIDCVLYVFTFTFVVIMFTVYSHIYSIHTLSHTSCFSLFLSSPLSCSDDDMISLASMMSISNLSMIGNLEDDDEDYTIKRWYSMYMYSNFINHYCY